MITREQTQLEQMFDDPDRIPIGEAAQNFFKIAQEVRETRRRKILTKNGRAYIAISPLVEVAMVEMAKKENSADKERKDDDELS